MSVLTHRNNNETQRLNTSTSLASSKPRQQKSFPFIQLFESNWISSNKYLSFNVYLIFMLNCFAVLYIFKVNSQLLGEEIFETTIFRVFANSSIDIYIGIIFNMATSVPVLIDLVIERLILILFPDSSDHEVMINEHQSETERLFLMLLNIFTGGIVLYFRNNSHIPYIYACVHSLQFVGSMGIILLLSNRLKPHFFAPLNIFYTQLFFALASVTAMCGFGHPISNWVNISVFFILGLFFYFLFTLIDPLFRHVWRKVTASESFSVNETCCLWYVVSTLITLILIPGVVASLKLFDWSSFSYADVIIFIYSFALFGIIVSCVPNRISRAAISFERMKMVQMKRTFIRYLSHEIRTPLNVVQTGIGFLKSDIIDYNSLQEREQQQQNHHQQQQPSPSSDNNLETALETITDIQHACSAAKTVLDDLLNFESIDAGTFQLSLEVEQIYELHNMAQRIGIIAKEKGIQFDIHDMCDHQSIDTRGNNADAEQDTFLYVDKYRIEQVMRNLMTNAVKFTPSGKSISVVIRKYDHEMDGKHFESQSIENITNNLSNTSLTKGLKSMALLKAQTKKHKETEKKMLKDNGYFYSGDIIVEIKDTGVGISPDNFSRVFGEFVQFDANKLQGGGGSGLGLCISKEIANQHYNGQITFFSDGVGYGTTFMFKLRTYTLKSFARLSTSPLSPAISEYCRGSTVSDRIGLISEMQANHTYELIENDNSFSLRSLCSKSRNNSHNSLNNYQIIKDNSNVDYDMENKIRQDNADKLMSYATINSYDKADIANTNYVEISSSFSFPNDGKKAIDLSTSPLLSSSNHDSYYDQSFCYLGDPDLFRILIVDDSELNRKMVNRTITRIIANRKKSSLLSIASHSSENKEEEIANDEKGKDNNNTLAIDFNKLKLEIVEADDGVTAVVQVQQQYFDIVFMDNIMLTMNGPQAAHTMRSSPVNYQGLIIGVTGNVMQEDLKDFIDNGANAIIKKPINVKEIENLFDYFRSKHL